MKLHKNGLVAALIIGLTLAWASPAAAVCFKNTANPNTAQSPDTRTALLELYTSEGCDSCPPADKWLDSVLKKYPLSKPSPYSYTWITGITSAGKTVLLRRSLDIGTVPWRTPLVKKTVYTPQIFHSGKELTSWRSEAQVEAAIT